MNVFIIIVILNIIFSLITLALYIIDKQKAKAGKWRIKEKTLLLFTYLFGAVGAFIGVFVVRHKTKHWYFVLSCIISMVIQVFLLYFTYNI